MGLFLTTLVIIFMFWDTHRVLASVLVASSFFAIALAGLVVLRAKVRESPAFARRHVRGAREGSRAAHEAPLVTPALASGAAG